MGATIQQFMDKFETFKTLPGGEPFTIEVTDLEATAVAREYVAENKALIRAGMKQETGFELDVDKPSITFRDDTVLLSVMAGVGFLKTKATLTADVKWDGKPVVVVRSVEVPVISVSPQELNAMVEEPLRQMMETVEEYAEIRSFKITDGLAVLEAVRK
ncbi:MAG: hypothetical protein E7226_03045 [Clostridiales bacterium]|nr:hypothetical protein [Clostridiales bacterium]